MSGMNIPVLRRVLLAASILIFAAVIVIVLAAVLQQGEWLKASETEPLELSVDGTEIRVQYSVEVESGMPYDLSDITASIYLCDHTRGSSALLGTVDGLTIEGGGKTLVEFDTGFSSVTTFLIFRDLAVNDGKPLHFDIVVSCGYLMGLASFTLTAEVDVPVSETDGKVDFDIPEDTDTRFTLLADNLAEWVAPDIDATISGGGHIMSVTSAYADGAYSVTLESSEGLDAAIDGMIASGGAVMVSGGKTTQLTSGDLEALQTALDLMRWYL